MKSVLTQPASIGRGKLRKPLRATKMSTGALAVAAAATGTPAASSVSRKAMVT
jgi:hypothetical protein